MVALVAGFRGRAFDFEEVCYGKEESHDDRKMGNRNFAFNLRGIG